MYYNTKASGARIRELRIAKNFTQDDLAEHMNVSRGFISLIESGRKGCSVDLMIQLSEALLILICAISSLRGSVVNAEAKKVILECVLLVIGQKDY